MLIALAAVQHHLDRFSKHNLKLLDLSLLQLLVVRAIGLLQPISAGALATLLCHHPSTLTSVFKVLQARGIVVRTEDADDRRRAIFRLTEDGQRLDATSPHRTLERVFETVVGGLDADDVNRARVVLPRLTTALVQNHGPDRERSPTPSP
jgi:DNA-binding MarR family transcriptional regulator